MSKTRVVVLASILTAAVVAYVGILRRPPNEATASQPAAPRDHADPSPQDNTPSPPPTKSEAAPAQAVQEPDWAVYRSEEFGYEIRYPRDATVRTPRPGRVLIGIGGEALPFSVSVIDNPQGISAQQWVEELKAEARRRAADEGPADYPVPMEFMDPERGPDEGPIPVGELSGYRIRTFGFDHESELVFVSAGTLVYRLTFAGADPNDPEFSSHHPIYLRILQTFRLLPEP